MSDLLYDSAHPLRSPLLGRVVSSTLCVLGHNVVVMNHEEWDEEWLACATCGARFMPTSMLSESDDEEVAADE